MNSADRWIEAEVAAMLGYRVVSMQVAAATIPNHEACMPSSSAAS